MRVSRRFFAVAAAAAALAVGGHATPASAAIEPAGVVVATPSVGGIALPIACTMDVSGSTTTDDGVIDYSGRTQCTGPVAKITSAVSFRIGLFLSPTTPVTGSCFNCTANQVSGSFDPYDTDLVYAITYETTITAPTGYTWQAAVAGASINQPTNCAQSSPTVITCSYTSSRHPHTVV